MLVESEPAITAGKHVTCINQRREGVTLTCHVRYRGSNMMPLLITWTASDGRMLINRTYNSFSLFMSSVCLPPSATTISSSSSSPSYYTCTASFSRPTGHAVFAGVHGEYYRQKSNAPSFTVFAAFHDTQPGG